MERKNGGWIVVIEATGKDEVRKWYTENINMTDFSMELVCCRSKGEKEVCVGRWQSSIFSSSSLKNVQLYIY